MVSRYRLVTLAAGWALLSACDAGAQPETALAEDTASGARGETLPECRVVEAGNELPDEVRETSGLARSRTAPGTFWTHNDAGNEPVLFAVSAEGRLLGRTVVQGAELLDWEDMASGPCEGGSCLFVGDIGDNDAKRDEIVIYQIPEPQAGAARSAPARVLRGRFPDGARDAEALFVLPTGDIYLVTKGREGPISLYRYPAPHRPGEVVTLERVRELAPEPSSEEDRITGATASPDGRWVGIRSYRSLLLYPAAGLVGGGVVSPVRIDLQPLGESQGESLALDDDGSVWLSSEAAGKDERPRWGRLQCMLEPAG